MGLRHSARCMPTPNTRRKVKCLTHLLPATLRRHVAGALGALPKGPRVRVGKCPDIRGGELTRCMRERAGISCHDILLIIEVLVNPCAKLLVCIAARRILRARKDPCAKLLAISLQGVILRARKDHPCARLPAAEARSYLPEAASRPSGRSRRYISMRYIGAFACDRTSLREASGSTKFGALLSGSCRVELRALELQFADRLG